MSILCKFINKVYNFFNFHRVFGERGVPFFCAKIFNFFYKKKLTNFDVLLNTYDGSGQLVHPDIIFDEGEQLYILAFTPYPFGIDYYENPSVMYGNSLSSLDKAYPMPISFSEKDERGCHLCDPVLLRYGNLYYCIFLDILNYNEKRECAFYYSISEDIKNWSEKKIIKKYVFNASEKKHVLCPAVVKYDQDLFFYTVHVDIETDSYLAVSKSCDLENLKQEKKCIIGNMPHDYYLWHMNICFYDDYLKTHSENTNRELLGMFLLRKKGKEISYKTVFAISKDFYNWEIFAELKIPKELDRKASAIYKGTVVPVSGDILISYRDINHCWRMAKIPQDLNLMEN